MGWNQVHYFDPEEFDSPDEPGSGKKNMEMEFVRTLDSVRESVGIPFTITSGYRTPHHNEEVGGVDSSAHVRGWAADVHVDDSRDRFYIVKAMMRWGINRIGIDDTYIHCDMDPEKYPHVMWVY